jgi:uncharacterized metal-binding protein YceD (DUF177 family)
MFASLNFRCMNKYEIKLGGITNGKNIFLFEIRDSFFESFDLSDVKYAEINVTAVIEKDVSNLILDLHLEGKINKLLCDICIEDISIEIKAETSIVIKNTNDNIRSTDEIHYYKKGDNVIDLKHLIFELIILNIPKKNTTPT